MTKKYQIPVLLSAFGFPGLGQFAQKRWIPGALFAAVFLIGFLWIMALGIHNMIELYSLAFDPDIAEPHPVPLSAFGKPLLLAAAVYLISLLDVFTAQQRILSAQHEEEFLKQHETSDS